MPAPQPYLPGRTRMPGDIPQPDDQPPLLGAPPPGQAPSQGGQQFPMIPPPPDNRDMLSQLIAMNQPGNPMGGGPQQYMNDIPSQGFEPQLPPGWQPPGAPPMMGAAPGQPSGSPQWAPTPPMPHFRAGPTNIVPPGKSTSRQDLVT